MRITFVSIALAVLAGCAFSQVLPSPGACGISIIKPKTTARVVNGEAAIPHSRPYQLLLVGFFPNGTAKYYCGASLIKPTHVLTAAHCVVGNEAKDLRIYPGVHNFTSAHLRPENGIPAQRYFSHESYSSSSLSSDVAVIRLQIPLEVDNMKIGLVCVASDTSSVCGVGHPVVASGWGSMSGNPNRTGASRPTQLQQVALQCQDPRSAACKPLTHNFFGLVQDRSKMCAYGEHKAVCFGDSGGPLVRERTLSDGTVYLEQVGIMSGTIDCSFTKPQPDLYADVRNLYQWIIGKVQASP